MPGTISIQFMLQVQNGYCRDQVQESMSAIVQTGKGFDGGTFALTDTAAALAFSKLTNLGWARLTNVNVADTSESKELLFGVDSGGSTMVDLGRLLPGESTVLRLAPGITLMAKMTYTGETGQLLAICYED